MYFPLLIYIKKNKILVLMLSINTNISNLPKWYLISVNPYILNNYRTIKSNEITRSFIDCILSLFTLHNETFNVYSHLLPGIYFIFSLASTIKQNYYLIALIQYKFCILFGYFSAIFMCLSSALAHTFYIIDPYWSNTLWKLDFISIIIINLSHQIYDIILLSKILNNLILYIGLAILFALYCIFQIWYGEIKTRRYWVITYPIISFIILTLPLFIYSQYFSDNIILKNASYGSFRAVRILNADF
jgi:predicted membrane channel-forming protein YqfA (hemolysin III family)